MERVAIEPFDIRRPCPYDLVIDRVTHWYHTSREWIKKSILMDGVYVLQQSVVDPVHGKTDHVLRDDAHLGLPVPRNMDGAPQVLRRRTMTWSTTLKRYAKPV